MDDLVLQASQDQSPLSNVRNVSKEAGQPNCPVYDGCTQVGTMPRDQAVAATAMNNSKHLESFACSAATRSVVPDGLTLFALSGFLGMAILRSRRRR